jgi:Na+-transporting NADH:ubiquinone oxidoreductase subunit A
MQHLFEGGMWPFIVQRPFSVVAKPDQKPKGIFISGFDSAPLAPDPDFVMEGLAEDFQLGVDALGVLADGKPVNIGYKKGSTFYTQVKGATLYEVSGPHPAGNVGVQIHHIAPINKGEVVWTVAPQDVANIGRFLRTGKFDVQRIVALTGSEVNSQKYFRVTIGTPMKTLVNNNLRDGDVRIISGNVLTGESVTAENYLGYYHHQVTVIPEGHSPKFFLTEGWLSPGLKKLSLSQAYPSWLLGANKRYEVDTNNNGEDRAFVVTGQYEKVFPFDIYPVHLVKAIMVNDIDQMEKLGIYEVAPEDFALCEFACTSKINVQEIVRQGLDTIMEEFS